MSENPSESERERLAAELTAEAPNWAEANQPGTFGCHELLDRVSMIANMVDSFILEHPACVANPDWFALAEQAVYSLNDLYQQVGAVHLDIDGPTGG
ncbi:MAG: hypothetical protein K8T89_16325 [Planctomycetes bacterium]|nr:hypothetical protein [Planctomycetota bacterium]